MISGEDVQSTAHPKIYSSEEYFYPWKTLEARLHQLINHAQTNHIGLVRAGLRSLVPEYKPQAARDVEADTQAPRQPIASSEQTTGSTPTQLEAV